MGLKGSETLSVFKKSAQSVSKMPLLTPENKLNERATSVFAGIFEWYAVEDPEDAGKKVISEAECTKYVQDATGQKQVDQGVAHILGFSSTKDGKMSLADFLYFYQESCTTRLSTVRSNLALMGYRDDLQRIPPPGSPENFLQARKSYLEMPRWKIAQNQESFASIVGLLDMQSEVSKEAQSTVKMICTNQETFWDILKLS